MWTFCVVVDAPIFDDHLCLPETEEDLPIEAFNPEFAVEGFTVAVRPTIAPPGRLLNGLTPMVIPVQYEDFQCQALSGTHAGYLRSWGDSLAPTLRGLVGWP